MWRRSANGTKRRYRAEHAQSRWAGLLLILAAVWLIASPPALGLDSAAMAVSDVVAGLLLLPLAVIALSWRHGWARWAIAPIGLWLLFAPLAFRAPTAAGYLNDTLVGAAVLALAVAIRPTPGVSPAAAETGPLAPPGWNHNPSAWVQRLPIVALAFVGFFIARYLTAYQLGHVEGGVGPVLRDRRRAERDRAGDDLRRLARLSSPRCRTGRHGLT